MLIGIALAPLVLVGCDGSDPVQAECTVTGVTISGLPTEIPALTPVELTADVESENCDDEPEVSWSAPEGVSVDAAGVLVSDVLGGPFAIAASAGGQEATADVVVGSAPTVSDDRWAVWWIDCPASDCDADGNIWAYTSEPSSTLRSTHLGPGDYQLVFEGLASNTDQREALHVSAYFTAGPTRCRVVSWSDTADDLTARVRCHDLAGAPTDSRFDVLLAPAGSTEGRSAFLVSPDPDATGVAAETAHNSTGGAIRVERSETGRYQIVFEGLSRAAVEGSGKEVFHVTAFGDGTEWCKIVGWGPAEETNLELDVLCLSPGGLATDARFVVLMLESGRPEGWRLAYVRADEEDIAGPYVPSTTYNFSSAGGSNEAVRQGVGAYRINWAGVERTTGSTAETNLVTAYGTDDTYCLVSGWSLGVPEARFLCYAPDGTPTDARFTAIWIE